VDLLARVMATALSEVWGVPVVVNNRAGGAGGSVGTRYVAQSAADGYTLLLAGSTHAILPSLQTKLGYDAVRDFAPISLIGTTPAVMVVPASLPVTSVKELVTLAKSKPGTLNYASTGNGTSQHLWTEMFKRQADVNIVHVPYRGSAPALNGLMEGSAQVMLESKPTALPHIVSGRLRALGVTSRDRIPELPNVPTMAEAGIPNFEVSIWYGLFAPAGIDDTVLMRLNSDTKAVLQTTAVKQQMSQLSITLVGTTPGEFRRVVLEDLERFARVVRSAGIEVD
jgi:tripartite-type tricarboxylate transporter receptor subunit TctC